MSKKIFIFVAAILLATTFFVACSDDDVADPIPDVSNIKVNIKIRRFEQDLFSIDTTNMAAGIQVLQQKYPMMSEIYTQIIDDKRVKDATPLQLFGGFVKSPYPRKLNDTVQIVYKDVSDLEQDLNKAFQFYKYYFPKKPIPEVDTYISEYGIGSITYGDSLLGIGLDFGLGAKHGGYDASEIPRYESRSMDRTHLVAKAMQTMVGNLSEEEQKGGRLLDVMVNNGKKLYILDKLLPYTADSVKFNYTQKQMDWCKQNEADVWAYILSDKLLYSVKQMDWGKLVNPSPSGTPKMPTDSPGRVGNWLGYKIVRAYMKKFPNTTMEQLLAFRDAQKMLDISKYKPKRR